MRPAPHSFSAQALTGIRLPALRGRGRFPAIHPVNQYPAAAADTPLWRVPAPVMPADTEWRGSAEHPAPAGNRPVGFSAHPLLLPQHGCVLHIPPAVLRLLPPLQSVLPDGMSALRHQPDNGQFFPADAWPSAPVSDDHWLPGNPFPDRRMRPSAPPARGTFPPDGTVR